MQSSLDPGQQEQVPRDYSLPPDVLEQALQARSRVLERDLAALVEAIRTAAEQSGQQHGSTWQDGIDWTVAFIEQAGHQKLMSR